MSKLYTRKTSIKLLDGREHVFHALPLCLESVEIAEALNSGEQARAMLRAVRLTLADEDADALLASGAIPLLPGPEGSEEARIYAEIMAAWISQSATD